MGGIVDRLGDLSWLGEAYADQGWVVVGTEDSPPMTQDDIVATIDQMLKNTAWAVAEDNTSMTKAQRIEWFEFRKTLREIPLQVGYPDNIQWPTQPE
jgi:hypothetical protein